MTSVSTDRRFGINSGAAVKVPCRCATTAAITLNGLQTIDGITVIADDRVLVKNQASAIANGIYIASTGNWPRAPDFDGKFDVKRGTLCPVNEGTLSANVQYIISTPDPILIGTSSLAFTTAGIFTNAILTQPAHNKLFVGDGAVINRLNDRVFVGDAGVNDGAFPNIVKDWLSTFQTAQAGGPANGTLIGCQMAVLANATAPIGGAIISGAESLNFVSANSAVITDSAFAINNNASFACPAWAFYAEAHRMNNVCGSVVGMELDVVQRGVLSQSNPYTQSGGEAVALQLDAGAGLSATGQFDCTAALVIGGNPKKFDKGIIVKSNSISGTDGVTGSGYAMAMAKGHILQWFNSSGQATGSIGCFGSSSSQNGSIQFNDGQTVILMGGLNSVVFNYVATAANYFVFAAGASGGSSADLTVTGSDSNVDMNLNTKGASYVKFATASHFSANGSVATAMSSIGPVGSHVTVQEWLTIRNPAGTLRYIPCF